MSGLNEKFQKLTGINGFDIEKFIKDSDDKVKAYNRLQWMVPKGLCRDKSLFHEEKEESQAHKNLILYAEVMTGLAEACGVSADNLDINQNESTDDASDKRAQEILSEAYAILDGYDSEDDDNNNSSN